MYKTGTCLLDITLGIRLTNGNDGRGNRWYRSASVRDRIETELRALQLVREPFPGPVRLRVTRILGAGQRLWDVSSVGRGNWKELEDALVACGWFVDDGPRWITGILFEQDDSDRTAGPAVRIEVFDAA